MVEPGLFAVQFFEFAGLLTSLCRVSLSIHSSGIGCWDPVSSTGVSGSAWPPASFRLPSVVVVVPAVSSVVTVVVGEAVVVDVGSFETVVEVDEAEL